MDEDKNPLSSLRSKIASRQGRDSSGRFKPKVDPTKIPPISVTTNKDQRVKTANPPDFVSFKITNPLVYIKYWWKRIMANEGIKLKFEVKPVTAIAISAIAFSFAFGLGGYVFPIAFPWMRVKTQEVTPSPTPQQEEWRDTALKGTLRKTSSVPVRYYLVTTSTEAITLEAPDYVNLSKLVGKRILAAGKYSKDIKTLIISDVQDLEVLPTIPVPPPTSVPTPSPTPTPISSPTPTIIPTPLASPTP